MSTVHSSSRRMRFLPVAVGAAIAGASVGAAFAQAQGPPQGLNYLCPPPCNQQVVPAHECYYACCHVQGEIVTTLCKLCTDLSWFQRLIAGRW
jgi:hypothetical protein